ncbi:MAG: hypothetical protein L6R48_00545 [Planctomycetes bacterium]|nr:hypothetical protein [Planctomycetota bacterium]
MGGILTGALAGVQDWDGVWRFAYAHAAARLEEPAASGYFDLASDPLNQLADRAAVLLYRGGLVPPARREVVVAVERAVPPPPTAGEAVQSRPLLLQGWGARLGTAHADRVPAAAVALPVARLAADPAGTLAAAGLDPDPAAARRSLADGGLVLDGRDGSLLIDLPAFAGGYAEPGARLEAVRAGVGIAVAGSGATVFVAALDRRPIASSRRLLVCHLTDLQNTGATYLEDSRRTLLAWGGLPHLVRRGGAELTVAVQEPERWRVHALDPAGRRHERLPAAVADGRLHLRLDVQGAQGARLCYEAEAMEDQPRPAAW